MESFELFIEKLSRLTPKFNLRVFSKDDIKEKEILDVLKEIQDFFIIVVCYPKEPPYFSLKEAVVKYLHGHKKWSYREIGSFLGISHETVRKIILRIKKIENEYGKIE